MEIYLKQGTIIYRFAVLPPEYEVESGADNTTEIVDKLGEINMLGKRLLKKISLSSFFPKRAYDFVQYTSFPTPKASVDMIERMKNNGHVQLLITGSKKINMNCTIDNFIWGENDATGDINFTIELTEYRSLKNNGSSRPTKSAKSTTYVVKKGDTLQKVSKKTTGTTANWKKIKKQNNLKSNSLKVGKKLVIKI